MTKETKFTKDETEFLQKIKDLIDEQVHIKMEKILKHQHHHHKHPHGHYHAIDEKEIERKCTEEVFHAIEGSMAAMIANNDKFFQLLKKDDVHLFHELEKQIIEDFQGVEKVENFHDLFKLGKKMKPNEQTLDKIYSLGMDHFHKGHFDQALLYFNWLCEADAKNPQMWFMSGVAKQSLLQYQEAVAIYYQTLSIDPNFLHGYTQLMGCLIMMGDESSARKVYDIFTHEVDPSVYEYDRVFVNNLKKVKDFL